MYEIISYLVIINIIGFVIMGIDKRKAEKHKWRISERTLFLVAVLGGSLGSIMGMKYFRHKTKHKKFLIGIPLILVIEIFIGIVFIYEKSL